VCAAPPRRLFADYFAGCPVLHAAGRTFPVQQLYLEDAYELTGYVLEADAPAALRAGRDRGAQRRLAATAGARNAAAVRAGWGDDAGGGAPLNPHYDEELYQDYR
jgi:ATP-dependent RNA helicase DHX29